MLERVKETVMIYQTNPKAIRFCCVAATVLEGILLGKPLKLSLENLVNMAMSSTTNFTLEDSDIGDACLFALMEAKMKDMAQVLEALNGEDEDHGGNSARFPSAFEIPTYLFYKAMAGGEIDEAAYVKVIRTNINAGGETCLRATSYFVGSRIWCCRWIGTSLVCGKVPQRDYGDGRKGNAGDLLCPQLADTYAGDTSRSLVTW